MSIHIDGAEKDASLPDVGEAKPCKRYGCHERYFSMGFGLAGGGYGPYEVCEVCGDIVSKTVLADDEA